MRRIDQIKNDECYPCCVAMVLDRPRKTVPYFCPRSLTPREWGAKWDDWFKAEGIERIAHYGPAAVRLYEPPTGLWIATVPGVGRIEHAVVMDGPKLAHDPYRWNRRVRRPRRFNAAEVLYA